MRAVNSDTQQDAQHILKQLDELLEVESRYTQLARLRADAVIAEYEGLAAKIAIAQMKAPAPEKTEEPGA